MAKVRVGLLFGGRSGEHEVSLKSAASILGALDREKYEVVTIGITPEGEWQLGADPAKALESGLNGGVAAFLPADPTRRSLLPVDARPPRAEGGSGWGRIDVFLPALHGPFGEDGTVQGLFELAGVPYVGAGVAASAVGMDKALMKAVFASAGLPQLPYVTALRRDLEEDPAGLTARIEEELGFPCFVKPANLGSSVGVSKADGPDELKAALEEAARYDRKLVVEQAADDCREVEVSVLGNDRPEASIPGEIVPSGEFYDYRAKYIDDRSELHIPARIEPQVAERVRELALKAFKAIDCSGLARVDFFVHRRSGQIWVNEINTFPGFTPISMYPKLWEHSGVPYPALLDRLIDLAFERHRDRSRNLTRYQPD